MSPIGKIFIVLNLFLAVAFLGWAAANLSNAQDYKTQLESEQTAHAQTKDDLSTQLESVTNDRNQFETELASMRGDRDSVSAERDRNKRDLDDQKGRNDANEQRLETIQGTLGEYSSTNQDLIQKLADANTALASAQDTRHTAENEREAALATQRGLEDNLRQATQRIAGLEVDKTSAYKDVMDLQTQVQTFVATFGVTASDLLVQPQIDGAVLMVSHVIQPGLVSINKGSNDGVQRGYIFEIYNGAQYKGRVRVETVQGDMCTAVILKTFEGRSIEQGDNAATRI
ncbi:MAG: hypothetical protein V3T22_05430 [Planctomycetota bacterium]